MSINFLHNWLPTAVAVDLGLVQIHWYGLIMASAIGVGWLVLAYLCRQAGKPKELAVDIVFWLVIGGLIGARIYHVGVQWPYYSAHLSEIFKIWEGGLAIHGALLGGVLALWLVARANKQNFWQLAGWLAIIMPLAQAIGRWGNYFNQELYGQPTTWPWGLPIAGQAGYFQPVFLYESLLNLVLFAWLWLAVKGKPLRQAQDLQGQALVSQYLIGYGLIRFFIEGWRLDPTPIIYGLRWPQIISLVAIILGVLLLIKSPRLAKKD